MNAPIGRTSSRGSLSTRSLLRGIGRAAIWTALALLLLRGALAEPSGGGASSPAPNSGAGLAPRGAAFAIRFARTYLSDPTQSALQPFLVEGAQLGSGLPPRAGQEVAQAEVSEIQELGDGRSLYTVACELRDARTLYLAVPIVRSEAGGVAALGAPSFVAAPGPAGVDPERPQPLAGPDADSIAALVGKFLPAYVSAGEAADLTYFVAPGSVLQPLGAGLDFVALTGVTQLGSREGPRREVLAAARLSDPVGGATYPVAYRLELVRRARWYVRAVEGAVA